MDTLSLYEANLRFADEVEELRGRVANLTAEVEGLREALEDARRILLEADSDAVKILDKALKGGK